MSECPKFALISKEDVEKLNALVGFLAIGLFGSVVLNIFLIMYLWK